MVQYFKIHFCASPDILAPIIQMIAFLIILSEFHFFPQIISIILKFLVEPYYIRPSAMLSFDYCNATMTTQKLVLTNCFHYFFIYVLKLK
jgi:hypothetical protein